MNGARLVLALALVTGLSRSAVAQPAPPGWVELAAGLRLAGTVSFPAVPVIEGTPGGSERTVFITRTRIEPSAAADVRLSVGLSRRFAIEGALAIGNATLATTVENDVEVGATVTVREVIRQYLVEGGITFSPVRWQRPRWAPFALAGGGYLRQLHEGRTLVDTGRTVYVGAGARVFLTAPQSAGVSSGLRIDLRGTLVTGGISVDESSRGLPVVHAAYFLRF